MTTKVALLACSGLGKKMGLITHEVGLKLKEMDPTIKPLCLAVLCTETEKYQDLIKESQVIVLDGCATRCATKILEKQEYKKVKKIFIPEESKNFDLKLNNDLVINDQDKELVQKISEKIISELKKESETNLKAIPRRDFGKTDYYEITYDKYLFRVPKGGYLFSENDCWVKPNKKTALIGITDFLQNNASDIIFVDLPEIGTEFDQFDEIVNFESVKALLQLIAPISGKVIAVNEHLQEEPELLNNDAYEQGWTIEVELNDFEEEKELLMDGESYFSYLKKKIEEQH